MIDQKVENQELEMLRRNKEAGFNYRKRREEQWNENYLLYRGEISTNRLTQRQTVHVPLMKNSVQTLLKDVDDMPVVYFKELNNDKQKEIFKNEYWKWTGIKNNFELQDIVDKKQVFDFGRSFTQWQICDGYIKMTVVDPQDILVSRYCDPYDLSSSRFLIHTHIFVPLVDLDANKDYDKQAIARLKKFYATEMGLVKASENSEMMSLRNEKMQGLGFNEVDQPILGETYVELTLHFVFRPIEKKEDDSDDEGNHSQSEIYLYVEADNEEILMKKRLEDVIGKTEDHYWQKNYPYESWASDLDKQDFWTDGVADVVRPSNQILDVFYSQLLENRTLRNLNMHYYNSNIEGFTPNIWNPIPWGWYGIPLGEGQNINDVLQTVEVADLSESLDEMQFIINMNEQATGATKTQQGEQLDKQVTLGEVQLALGEAKERIKGMSKFYTPAWKKRGEIFMKLIEAAPEKLDIVKLYKKGRNTDNMYSREVSPKDWMSEAGYTCQVWSQDEKNTEDTNNLQKLNAAKMALPENQKLVDIYDRKLLEFAGLTPDEINEIMQEEQSKREQMMNMAAMQTGVPQPGQGSALPAAPPQPLLPAGNYGTTQVA